MFFKANCSLKNKPLHPTKIGVSNRNIRHIRLFLDYFVVACVFSWRSRVSLQWFSFKHLIKISSCMITQIFLTDPATLGLAFTVFI